MKRVFFFAVLVFFFAFQAQADKPKSLFYLTSDSTSIHSFLAHADKVDLLAPAWYNANAEGLVSGGPNPLVMEAAKQHHVPVMPLVVNAGFVQAEFHKFLGDPAAQKRMLDALIRAQAGGHGVTDFFDLLSEEAGRSRQAALAAAC